MRRDHQPPRDLIGNLGAVVTAHKVETEIDPGSAAGRREDSPLVDVQDVWFHADPGKAAGQRLCISPMRRGALTVEKPGGSQHEHAGTDRDDSRPLTIGALYASEQDL